MKIILQNAQYNSSFGMGIKKLPNIQNKGVILEKSPAMDTFCKTESTKARGFFTQIPILKAFKRNKDKFQISDYLALAPNDRLLITENAKPRHKRAAEINLSLGMEIKDKYDNIYGKDGYVFVSIGTSPSLIAKVLEFQGVEVKYLPISDLAGDSTLDEICKKYDFAPYLNFVSNQGVNNKAIEQSGKTFVFVDYTKSGATLRKFKQLMTEKMGLNREKIAFRSLNDDLINSKADTTVVKNYIDDYLLNAYAADYSSVNHLPYRWIGKAELTPQNFSLNERKDPKFFNFLVMDKLHQLGLLLENPNNDKII